MCYTVAGRNDHIAGHDRCSGAVGSVCSSMVLDGSGCADGVGEGGPVVGVSRCSGWLSTLSCRSNVIW